jgi:gamma-glutamylputrescine oxidase
MHPRRAIGRLSCDALGDPPWERPAPPIPTGQPPKADVVIVGGGLTGLSSAIALARSGRDVVVLEEAFGRGATSRSGGIVLGDTFGGPSPEFEMCVAALREWIDDRHVACEATWQNCLELVRDESLPQTPIDWRETGIIRLSKQVEAGVLDPSRLLSGVLVAALDAGAVVVNGSSVVALERAADGVVVQTNRGAITAREVVVAADALIPSSSIDLWDERAVTVAIQTTPIGEDNRKAAGLAPNQAFYTDDLPLLWGRVMPDGSLLIGRETLPALTAESAEGLPALLGDAGRRLLERTRGLHDALKTVELRRAWGGPTARTARGIPLISTDPVIPHVVWAGGYGGHGIAQAFRMGALIAKHFRA